jgi:hypothetical protein
MTVSGGIRVRLREDLTAVDKCCGCLFGQATSSKAEGIVMAEGPGDSSVTQNLDTQQRGRLNPPPINSTRHHV